MPIKKTCTRPCRLRWVGRRHGRARGSNIKPVAFLVFQRDPTASRADRKLSTFTSSSIWSPVRRRLRAVLSRRSLMRCAPRRARAARSPRAQQEIVDFGAAARSYALHELPIRSAVASRSTTMSTARRTLRSHCVTPSAPSRCAHSVCHLRERQRGRPPLRRRFGKYPG
jgi:hypothetical protein